MSRLRRFNRSVLLDGSDFQADIDDSGIPDLPMDTDEQEELIERFEISNTLRNKRYANTLSLTYLLFSGLCLMMASKAHGREMALLVLQSLSIICSMVLARYELMHSYPIFGGFSIYINNSRIQVLNVVLIVLIEWIGFASHDPWSSQLFRQIPVVLFLITRTLKKWSEDMEQELNQLRKMKYRYKNAWGVIFVLLFGTINPWTSSYQRSPVDRPK